MKYGNIISLHDAGEDQSNTIKALPVLIEKLRAEGYQFVTTSQALGKTREQTMPPVSTMESLFIPFNQALFTVVSALGNGFTYFLYFILILGFIQIFLFMYFSFQQRRKMRKRGRKLNYLQLHYEFQPLVSVVIAAYNEEKVINKTIHSVLQSDYPSLEVIIVNDGSTDQTEAVIKQEFANRPSVRVITKENGGKTSAINLGYKEANGEIIVSIDADTIIAENTISMLIRHFQDSKVMPYPEMSK